MKKAATITILVIFLFGLFTVSNATEAIKERPDISVTIDCVTKEYSNTPIIINGRTLLPLRELLINLNVANDDEHIIWNSKEKSVLVKQDSTTLYLKTGSIVGFLNDREVFLDTPPVNYKGSVYIPARFVAEAFGKVVVWDEEEQRILIRDEKEFEEAENIMTTAGSLMDHAKFLKVDSKVVITKTDSSDKLTSEKVDEIDREKQIIYSLHHLDMIAYISKIETYLEDHTLSTRIGTSTEWESVDLTDEEHSFLWDSATFDALIGYDKTLYASTIISQQNGTTLLTGDLYLEPDYGDYYDYDETVSKEVSDSSIRFEFDQDGYLRKVEVDVTYRNSEDEEGVLTNLVLNYAFTDYDRPFTIEKPKGL